MSLVSLRTYVAATVFLVLVAVSPNAMAQGLGGAGTVEGMVKDPTGGPMTAVQVQLSNPVTGFSRTATTGADGRFVFHNVPENNYRIDIALDGFQPVQQSVDVRTAVPIHVELTLQLAGVQTTVQVVGHAEDLVERDPTAHTDVDQALIDKLPVQTGTQGLNQIVTLASPGVVADSNGFFHPVGDHAQTQFSIDNQPVTDQQSRVYSNQISPDAVQSMELITGVAPAEYGDKSSLVVHIVTKSGLDDRRPTGDVSLGYGSFRTPTAEANVGVGSHRFGNFVSIQGSRTDRYLDPPEFTALHDRGSSVSLFDRVDLQTGAADTLHLNLQAARSGFDVPNTLDQQAIGQAQHQRIDTFNIAPGYSFVIGSRALLTANAYVRRDHLVYSPSADPFADQPATVSQDRTLTNLGAKADLAYTAGVHNVKVGGEFNTTPLHERFTFGITDPTAPDFADETGAFDPTFAPYVLGQGGAPLNYDQSFTVKSGGVYAQDSIKAHDATVNVGVRLDHYAGLATATLVQPRLGVSYNVARTNSVLRASYGRTLETPYNENLLLASGYGLNGLFGDGAALQPGRRNEMEVGIQQAFGGWVVADVGYFNKRTRNGYDFSVLFDTPIEFPVAWDHSRINGFTGRVNLVQHHGFTAFVVMAHTNAIYSPPGTGGILLEQPDGPFRIDHDQKFNATTNLAYNFAKPLSAWVSLTWRYDSGLVAGAVGSIADALALTGDQQAAIGFYCGSVFATPSSPIGSCDAGGGATRLRIPAEGTEDDLTNPPRIAPRNVFDLGFGVDNLLRSQQKNRVTLRVTVLNLTNKEALYNFLSTFGGTHFYTPRAVQVTGGIGF